MNLTDSYSYPMQNTCRFAKFLAFCVLFLSISNKMLGQNYSDSSFNSIINRAIITGDAALLTQIVNGKVDLVLPEKSGIYSKRQAKFILQGFFDINKPESFQLMNKNNSNSYFVGKLHTAKKHYRVCLLTKQSSNKLYIYQIRIEE